MAISAVTVNTSSTDLGISGSVNIAVVTNTGSSTIYLAPGETTAVVGQGIVLYPTQAFTFQAETIKLGKIVGIASGSSSTTAIYYA